MCTTATSCRSTSPPTATGWCSAELGPDLAPFELAGLGACVDDRLQPFAGDWLGQSLAHQLILDAQTGGQLRLLVQRDVGRALGRGDGRRRARRDAFGELVDE